MSRVGRVARTAMFLRSFAIQGSWNYRTLLGTGLAFSLLPGLRALFGDRPDRLDEAAQRHAGLFNAHPYLASMGIGALITMEEAGEDPAVMERFKSAIRGSLGTLGDRLVWAGWRPVCLLLGVGLLLLGVRWWVAAVAFLVVYNAGHVALRLWAYRLGLQRGRAVGEQLRRSVVPQLQQVFPAVGAFLLGLTLPLLVAGRLVRVRLALPWVLAAVLVAVLGARYGERVRKPILIGLTGLTLLALLLELVV